MQRAHLPLLFLFLPIVVGCDDTKKPPIQTGKRTGDAPKSPEPSVDDTAAISKEDRAIAVQRLVAAIDAHGQRYGKLKTSKQTMKGLVQSMPTEHELYVDLPGSARLNGKMTTPMGLREFSLCTHNNTGWRSLPPDVVDMPANELEDFQNELHYQWVATLRPLAIGDFGLRPLPETKFRDRAMLGIRVTRKDRRPVSLWFDKETNMLARMYSNAREAGIDFHRETYYSKHQPFEDVKLPTHVEEYRNGAMFIEWTSIEYKFIEVLDEALFRRPKS
jgi:hypothetical protein